MKLITLSSGGLDSTVMNVLAKEEGFDLYPLFVNYGQINKDRELAACKGNFARYNLPEVKVVELGGYGSLLSSGLTDKDKHILEDAFLPCRNLMLITVGAAYAYQCGAEAVGIGLLDDAYSLFGDQTQDFVSEAESLVSRSLGKTMRVLAPLMSFSKADVVSIASAKGIAGTYSCHAGTETPCGVCIACREYIGLEV